jgi:hypothetical protein
VLTESGETVKMRVEGGRRGGSNRRTLNIGEPNRIKPTIEADHLAEATVSRRVPRVFASLPNSDIRRSDRDLRFAVSCVARGPLSHVVKREK